MSPACPPLARLELLLKDLLPTSEQEELTRHLEGCTACQEALERLAIVLTRVSEDLHSRGVHRLMVEGGGSVLTQFLTADLADELQLVVAPFFVGDSQARRFVSDGRFPWHPQRRATLAEVRQIGDVVLLRYALSPRYRGDSPGEG